jgi:hypothetical protein
VPQIAGAIDLLPTLTALAEMPRVGDKPLDGRDLSPLLRKQSVDWPDRTLMSTWAGKVSARTQRFRLDSDGQLFDLVTDPGQTTPVSEQFPEVAGELRQQVRNWRQEVLSPGNSIVPRPAGQTVDPRPFPVGYPEFPITMLPARDGEPQGGVKRSSPAPNCSYFINWTSLDDRIVWNVQVQTAGDYDVVIDYTCPVADSGSRIEVLV